MKFGGQPKRSGKPVFTEDPRNGASRTRTGDLLGAIQATEMQNAEIADDLRGERAGNASL